MYEVIISSVTTGKVRRKLFDSREAADRHIERFFNPPPRPKFRPPLPRNYRVEVCRRELPVVKSLPAVAATAAA